MAKQFLTFLICTAVLASCKCGDKQVHNDTGNKTAFTATTTDENAGQNLREMSKEAANPALTTSAPGDANDAQMTKMYRPDKNAKKAMGEKQTMRRQGKLTGGFYPEGSERRLTENDVQYLTVWGHKVMLNEIYARHGMIFKDEALRKHFSKQSWYHPRSRNVYSSLSDIEKQNISFLINTSEEKETTQQGYAATR